MVNLSSQPTNSATILILRKTVSYYLHQFMYYHPDILQKGKYTTLTKGEPYI